MMAEGIICENKYRVLVQESAHFITGKRQAFIPSAEFRISVGTAYSLIARVNQQLKVVIKDDNH
jgi:hypothetical protein